MADPDLSVTKSRIIEPIIFERKSYEIFRNNPRHIIGQADQDSRVNHTDDPSTTLHNAGSSSDSADILATNNMFSPRCTEIQQIDKSEKLKRMLTTMFKYAMALNLLIIIGLGGGWYNFFCGVKDKVESG